MRFPSSEKNRTYLINGLVQNDISLITIAYSTFRIILNVLSLLPMTSDSTHKVFCLHNFAL